MRGEIDWIALLDPNHDNKNTRYQLIGGSGTIPACIGKFVFDPFLLVLASAASGVPHVDLVRYVDYASDKVALDLYSSKVIKSVMDLNSGDIGNSTVVVVSLTMSRMRSFAVNSRTASWKTRCIFVWTGLLWYTSFHKQTSTFLTNQRNIALESIALLFLILRSDVPNIRRATSEPNEHFYGLLRQMLREFKTDELVHLVNKLMQKVNAMFRGNLVPRRSSVAHGYGYLSTFPDWLEHMRAGRYVFVHWTTYLKLYLKLTSFYFPITVTLFYRQVQLKSTSIHMDTCRLQLDLPVK